MTTKTMVGVDVSKLTLDVFCLCNNQHTQIENNAKGFKTLGKWIKQMKLIEPHVVFEHTGMYSYLLEGWLTRQQITYSVVPALQIKKSMGIVRGKTDRIDAHRIAQYAARNEDKLPAPMSFEDKQVARRLQSLSNYKEKLIVQRAGFIAVVEDTKLYKELTEKDILIKSHRQMITVLTRQIETIEKEIAAVIKSQPALQINYKLLQTITGIGKQTALEAIILTANFTRFENARKFASFCGTAPFPYDSGTSIKGRTKVSHFANKKMKSLLFMAAQSAILHDPELRTFYHKKVQLGKSKMSTINVIKNKLIGRMFAVIQRQTPFITLHQFAA